MPAFSLGDITGNGTIGTKDATLMLSHINGISGYTLTDSKLIQADINNDGNVNNNDIEFIKDYLVKRNKNTVYLDPNQISVVFNFKLPT